MSNNFASALGQLRGLKRQFDNDPPLKTKYKETISSDLRKGYVLILSSDELASTLDNLVWYVPHHPVLNPHKPDKVGRFAMQQGFLGYSLNDTLLAGPHLMASVMGILSKFRENKFAMTADIEEMFLQVEVKPEHRKILRFLWFDENYQVFTYQNNRHNFGGKSSPTCANFALQRCALDNASVFERSNQIASHYFYLDDLLVSLNSEETAVAIKF